MSSSSSSSSSSLLSDSLVEDGGEVAGRVREPASARMRSGNGVWPEPFVEALAVRVATDAAAEGGRLAAAPALAAVFQVCSTWQTIFSSELLWQELTRQIWRRDNCLYPTWREEYIHRHRTAYNFRLRRAVYRPLEFDPGVGPPQDDGRTCRCLALSNHHLAGGFLDGSVRLFDLYTGHHIRTFRPQRRDRLGQFSNAIAGIVLQDFQIVFASYYGDIHVTSVHDPGPNARCAHRGDLMNDGILVDFAGYGRWWVGLYAGVPRRALHVWDSTTEELVFVGGSLTDPDALLGWRLLNEFSGTVGRGRVSSFLDLGIAATKVKLMALDLQQQGLVLGEEEVEDGVIVETLDVCNDMFLVIDNAGVAKVRKLQNFEEVCTFAIRRDWRSRRILGCLNSGYTFVYSGGVIDVWDLENGELLGRLGERIGEATSLIADEDHVAGCSSDSGIHLWTFSAA